MQIKDLSVKAERLDEVRGGINDVNTAVVGSTIYANQQVNVGGFGSVQTDSPTLTDQTIIGTTVADINTTVSESYSSSNVFEANGSSFYSSWGYRAW